MKYIKTMTILFLFICSFALNANELVTLNTRANVTQKFILIKPDNPVATVILFAGGKGNLNLSLIGDTPNIGWLNDNFLVRSKVEFVRNNFMVAIVDSPSDQKSEEGMYGGFRHSKEHVQDIDAVIAYLRQMKNIPIWIVGTSRGTESATNIAIYSQQKPNGLVVTSSVTVSNKNGKSITQMDLDKIVIPTLIVAHKKDKCKVTPPTDAKKIANALTHASKVEVKIFVDGNKPISKPCKAKSYHGFLGIEEKVVDYISDFIKEN